MKTLLIGATGATGSDLLQLLLNDGEMELLTLLGQKVKHKKLTFVKV